MLSKEFKREIDREQERRAGKKSSVRVIVESASQSANSLNSIKVIDGIAMDGYVEMYAKFKNTSSETCCKELARQGWADFQYSEFDKINLCLSTFMGKSMIPVFCSQKQKQPSIFNK